MIRTIIFAAKYNDKNNTISDIKAKQSIFQGKQRLIKH